MRSRPGFGAGLLVVVSVVLGSAVIEPVTASASSVQYQWPRLWSEYDASDGYGSMLDRSSPHRGTDWVVPTGTPVWAAADGVVVYDDYSSCLGNVVAVRFADGKFGGYAHLSSSNVDEGQPVSRGTQLGLAGNTGSCSYGSHLHFSMGDNQSSVAAGTAGHFDPIPYIQTRLNASTSSGLVAGVAVLSTNNQLVTWGGDPAAPGSATNRKLYTGGTGMNGSGTTLARPPSGSNWVTALNGWNGNVQKSELLLATGEPGVSASFASTGAYTYSISTAATTPSVTFLPDGKVAVAYRNPSKQLAVWWGNPNGTGGTTHLLGRILKDGTDPTITTIGNDVAVTFVNVVDSQMWTARLAVTGALTAATTEISVVEGIPGICKFNSQIVTVVKASNGNVFTWTGMPGTKGVYGSPPYAVNGNLSCAQFGGSEIVVAFWHAQTSNLWTWRGAPATFSAGAVDTTLSIGSSPSVVVNGSNAMVAFRPWSPTELWLWKGTPATIGYGATTSIPLAGRTNIR